MRSNRIITHLLILFVSTISSSIYADTVTAVVPNKPVLTKEEAIALEMEKRLQSGIVQQKIKGPKTPEEKRNKRAEHQLKLLKKGIDSKMTRFNQEEDAGNVRKALYGGTLPNSVSRWLNKMLVGKDGIALGEADLNFLPRHQVSMPDGRLTRLEKYPIAMLGRPSMKKVKPLDLLKEKVRGPNESSAMDYINPARLQLPSTSRRQHIEEIGRAKAAFDLLNRGQLVGKRKTALTTEQLQKLLAAGGEIALRQKTQHSYQTVERSERHLITTPAMVPVYEKATAEQRGNDTVLTFIKRGNHYEQATTADRRDEKEDIYVKTNNYRKATWRERRDETVPLFVPITSKTHASAKKVRQLHLTPDGRWVKPYQQKRSKGEKFPENAGSALADGDPIYIRIGEFSNLIDNVDTVIASTPITQPIAPYIDMFEMFFADRHEMVRKFKRKKRELGRQFDIDLSVSGLLTKAALIIKDMRVIQNLFFLNIDKAEERNILLPTSISEVDFSNPNTLAGKIVTEFEANFTTTLVRAITKEVLSTTEGSKTVKDIDTVLAKLKKIYEGTVGDEIVRPIQKHVNEALHLINAQDITKIIDQLPLDKLPQQTKSLIKMIGSIAEPLKGALADAMKQIIDSLSGSSFNKIMRALAKKAETKTGGLFQADELFKTDWQASQLEGIKKEIEDKERKIDDFYDAKVRTVEEEYLKAQALTTIQMTTSPEEKRKASLDTLNAQRRNEKIELVKKKATAFFDGMVTHLSLAPLRKSMRTMMQEKLYHVLVKLDINNIVDEMIRRARQDYEKSPPGFIRISSAAGKKAVLVLMRRNKTIARQTKQVRDKKVLGTLPTKASIATSLKIAEPTDEQFAHHRKLAEFNLTTTARGRELYTQAEDGTFSRFFISHISSLPDGTTLYYLPTFVEAIPNDMDALPEWVESHGTIIAEQYLPPAIIPTETDKKQAHEFITAWQSGEVPKLAPDDSAKAAEEWIKSKSIEPESGAAKLIRHLGPRLSQDHHALSIADARLLVDQPTLAQDLVTPLVSAVYNKVIPTVDEIVRIIPNLMLLNGEALDGMAGDWDRLAPPRAKNMLKAFPSPVPTTLEAPFGQQLVATEIWLEKERTARGKDVQNERVKYVEALEAATPENQPTPASWLAANNSAAHTRSLLQMVLEHTQHLANKGVPLAMLKKQEISLAAILQGYIQEKAVITIDGTTTQLLPDFVFVDALTAEVERIQEALFMAHLYAPPTTLQELPPEYRTKVETMYAGIRDQVVGMLDPKIIRKLVDEIQAKLSPEESAAVKKSLADAAPLIEEFKASGKSAAEWLKEQNIKEGNPKQALIILAENFTDPDELEKAFLMYHANQKARKSFATNVVLGKLAAPLINQNMLTRVYTDVEIQDSKATYQQARRINTDKFEYVIEDDDGKIVQDIPLRQISNRDKLSNSTTLYVRIKNSEDLPKKLGRYKAHLYRTDHSKNDYFVRDDRDGKATLILPRRYRKVSAKEIAGLKPEQRLFKKAKKVEQFKPLRHGLAVALTTPFFRKQPDGSFKALTLQEKEELLKGIDLENDTTYPDDVFMVSDEQVLDLAEEVQSLEQQNRTISIAWRLDPREVGVLGLRLGGSAKIHAVFIEQRKDFVLEQMLSNAEVLHGMLSYTGVPTKKSSAILKSALNKYFRFVKWNILKTQSLRPLLAYWLFFELFSFLEEQVKRPGLGESLWKLMSNDFAGAFNRALLQKAKGMHFKQMAPALQKELFRGFRSQIMPELMKEQMAPPMILNLMPLLEGLSGRLEATGLEKFSETLTGPWLDRKIIKPNPAILATGMFIDPKILAKGMSYSFPQLFFKSLRDKTLRPGFYDSMWFKAVKRFMIAVLTMRQLDSSYQAKLLKEILDNKGYVKALLEQYLARKKSGNQTIDIENALRGVIDKGTTIKMSSSLGSFASMMHLPKMATFFNLGKPLLAARSMAVAKANFMLLLPMLGNAFGVPQFIQKNIIDPLKTKPKKKQEAHDE